ncbi:MAG: dual specificity protein phosphatase [bacterium]|nr:dual specificity protein phosphatase [bacterium]
MHKIRDWLYVASFRETQDLAQLKNQDIGAILHLHQPVEHEGIDTLFVPVQEGFPLAKNDIVRGLNFINEQHAQGKKVVVACGAGISRSVIFATGALKMDESLTMTKSFAEIRKKHERAMPDELHWQSMCAYFNETIDFWEMWRTIEL